MIRLVLALCALSFVAVDSASACSRCGLFGNRCRYYKPTYYAPTYVPAAVVQQPSVFVVQNSYPAPLAVQGATQYGYQAAAAVYSVNPAEVLRQSAELSRAASLTAQIGLNGYNSTAQTQLALQASITEPLARGQAASQVLHAAGLSQRYTQQQQSLALRIYQENGQWKVEQASAEQVNQQVEQASNPDRPPPAPTPDRNVSILGQKCAKCHGLQLAEPKGGAFFDAGHKLNCNLSWLAVRKIKSGEMPPKSEPQLTADEKGRLLDELDSLTELAQ